MKIFKNDFSKETCEIAESLLFNGNGYIGVRNNLEEDLFTSEYYTNKETYLNGFYELQEVSHPEKFVGFIDSKQTMIPVVDGQTTIISVDGEEVTKGNISEHHRYVDISKGISVREFVFETSTGLKTKIKIERLTSFVHLPLFYMNYSFEKINHDAEIELKTYINYFPIKTVDKNDPRMDHNILKVNVTKEGNQITFNTKNSKLEGNLVYDVEYFKEEVSESGVVLHSKVKDNQFTKKLMYLFEQDEVEFISYEELKKSQIDFLKDFWETSYIKVESKFKVEEALNYGTYCLLSSLGRTGMTSIAAKGLSGLGYEGHYFWDSEMYIFTNFLLSAPDIAKKILEFRLHTLDKAISNARMLGYNEGALYPWRTINGDECSPFFESGMAQHHINCDIAYAFIKYYQITGDKEYFEDAAINVLLETSRFFVDLVYLKDGKYHLDAITGPDEYTTVVNDNYYTNKMIQYQLHQTICIVDDINPELLNREEREKWSDIADNMSLPLSDDDCLVAQDRNFFEKEKWDFEKNSKSPLLLHYHPLMIYRYQVSKQADAILALATFNNEYDVDFIKRNLDYYEKVTTHDSSLSFSTFAILYAKIKDEKAVDYFLKNLRLDLDNIHQNTKDGIHTASMGGSYKVVLEGFLGMTVDNQDLNFSSNLPEGIEKIELKYFYRGKKFKLKTCGNEVIREEIQ